MAPQVSDCPRSRTLADHRGRYLIAVTNIGIGINIDVTNFGWVTIHSCEEDLKVPYRYYKKFVGKKFRKYQA